MIQQSVKQEENGIVLDFLPHGQPMSKSRRPIAQVLGKDHFVLLEVQPKQGVFLQPGEKVYLGREKREKIHHVLGRIPITALTRSAKLELRHQLEEVVGEKEERFVEFFNKSGPVSMRLHSLELLPGIGKKHMWAIIEERKDKEFESFAEIVARVDLMPDPKKTIVKRIIEEMEGADKHHLFVG